MAGRLKRDDASEYQQKMRLTIQNQLTAKSFPMLAMHVTERKLFIYRAGGTEPMFIFNRKDGCYFHQEFIGTSVRECMLWAHRKLFGSAPGGKSKNS